MIYTKNQCFARRDHCLPHLEARFILWLNFDTVVYAEVGRHLATLNVAEMRWQPIYVFFQEDSTLDYYPAWQREWLRHKRDQPDEGVLIFRPA